MQMKPVVLGIILVAAVFLVCVGICAATGVISYTEKDTILDGKTFHIRTLTCFGVTTTDRIGDNLKVSTRYEGKNVTTQSWFREFNGSWTAGKVQYITPKETTNNPICGGSGVTYIQTTENGWVCNNWTTNTSESSLFRCGWKEITPPDGIPWNWTTCHFDFAENATADIFWTAENETILTGIKAGVKRCKELQESIEKNTREGSWSTVRSTVQQALEGSIDADTAAVIIGSNWLIEPWEGAKMIEEGIGQSNRISVNMRTALANRQS